MQPKITFIGVGNMAKAIIRGLIQSGYPASCLSGTSRTQEKHSTIQMEYNITMMADNAEAIKEADIVVLCVKPAQMQDVIAHFQHVISKDQLYVSVAAGIELASLQAWLGEVPIVRSMPNTPAQFGKGITGLVGNKLITAQQKEWANTVFSSVGDSVWVNLEADMHTVTALSGSAPAYFLRFLEAMIETGKAHGLDEQTCHKLACNTMLGTAHMAIESSEDIAVLRQNITSPGGTTEQALLSLEANKITSVIEQAMAACIRRSQEMTTQFSATSEH